MHTAFAYCVAKPDQTCCIGGFVNREDADDFLLLRSVRLCGYVLFYRNSVGLYSRVE